MSKVLITHQPKKGFFTLVTGISLATLPFVQALTANVGFPLKVYEILLLASLMLLPMGGRLLVPTSAIPAAKITAYWMLLVSGFLTLKLMLPPTSMSEVGIVTRFGPVGEGVTKLVYLWLDLLGFVLFAAQARRDETFFIRCWLAGSLLAASYAFYLFTVSGLLGMMPPMLPGGRPSYFAISDIVFIRNATFNEGNHSGLYFLISMLLAFHTGRKKTGFVLLLASLTTFSTAVFALLLVYGGFQAWKLFTAWTPRLRFFLAPVFVVMVAVAGVVVINSAAFQATVVVKLDTEDETGMGQSRLDRLRTAKAGLEMFLNNPLTGVGLAQFGYNVEYYEPSTLTLKQIPNMVYVEFLSEDGLIVFGLFLIFIWMLYRRTGAPDEIYLRFGVLSMLIGFFAYPTISIMFLWAFFGYVFGRLRSVSATPIATFPVARARPA